METFTLTGEFVTLAQAIKAVGFAGSGGEAKHIVRGGSALVNGIVEIQPGRKLRVGDRFALATDGGKKEWKVVIDAEE